MRSVEGESRSRRSSFSHKDDTNMHDGENQDYYGFKVPFLFLLFIHMFILVITFILIANTTPVSEYLISLNGSRFLLALIGLLSSNFASSYGLLFYIVGQVISLGFEFYLVFINLRSNPEVTCQLINQNISDVHAKEKILSISFIIITCLAAARIRSYLSKTKKETEKDTEKGKEKETKKSQISRISQSSDQMNGFVLLPPEKSNP
eukprot:c14940_g1_i2.p1 GENE.c14940_g1_i2~~c14940_g1_i2.p1  ORF type:complete len:206 (-),score=60.19 c14940_g1_i2:48-665(-)